MGTERNAEGIPYFTECFREPCKGISCRKDDCAFLDEVCERLCEYEERNKERYACDGRADR